MAITVETLSELRSTIEQMSSTMGANLSTEGSLNEVFGRLFIQAMSESGLLVGSRTSFVPDDSPFADNTARDTWASANLDELFNNNEQVTVITVDTSSFEWAGENEPSSYNSNGWVRRSGDVDLSGIPNMRFLYNNNGELGAASAEELATEVNFIKSIRTLAESVGLGLTVLVSDLGGTELEIDTNYPYTTLFGVTEAGHLVASPEGTTYFDYEDFEPISSTILDLENHSSLPQFGLFTTEYTHATIVDLETQLTVRNASGDTINVGNIINDQSSSNYMDVGNSRMQWGTFSDGDSDNDVVITLPAAFSNTSYVVTCTSANTSVAVACGVSSTSTTTFTFNRNDVANGVGNWNYIAIGIKP